MKPRVDTQGQENEPPCRFIHTEAEIGAAKIPRSKATIWLERFIAVKCVCARARHTHTHTHTGSGKVVSSFDLFTD